MAKIADCEGDLPVSSTHTPGINSRTLFDNVQSVMVARIKEKFAQETYIILAKHGAFRTAGTFYDCCNFTIVGGKPCDNVRCV